MDTKLIGKLAFILGLLIALIGAFVDVGDIGLYLLMIFGLVAGFLRVSKENQTGFFVLFIALALSYDALGAIPTIGSYITDFFSNSLYFLSVVVIAVVLKHFYKWVTE